MNPRGRFVGREPVLAAATAVLRDAASGAGQFLMVSGEAGIGKTAVLAALAERAGPDWTVLRGVCWDRPGAPPYWPWSQILRATCVAPVDLGEARRLVETPANDGRDAAIDAGEAADAEFSVFEAVGQCLSALAAERPILVVLDDLHWADAASLRLLGFLSRTLVGSRLVLAGAYRDIEASDDLLAVAATAQHLRLGGLGVEQVRELVTSIVGPDASELGDQVWERSGGNPFFVGELARLMVAQGTPDQPPPIPAGIAETLRRRLARLSTDCVHVLERVAVAGGEVDTDLLVLIGAAGNEMALNSLLDEARRAGVVTDGPDGPRLSHDLYRETILGGLSATTRTEIDLALGLALQERPGGAARVAAHLLAAGSQVRRKAVEYSVLAAREATTRLGHDDACGHYRRALQMIDAERTDVPWDPARGELLVELAGAHARAGRGDEARTQYLAAAATARATDDAVVLARAALGIESLGQRSGAHRADVLDLLEQAAARLGAVDGSWSLQSRVYGAKARMLRHGSIALPDETVAAAAERAVELAAAAGDSQALAEARLAQHDSQWTPGTARRRLPLIAAMLDAATAAHDADLVAQGHQLRAAALLELGDPAGRDELLTYITLADRLGHARGRWGALTRRATFAQLAGHADEAARLGEEALELGLAIGVPDAVGCFCTSRWALVALGIPEPPPGELDPADPLWPMFPLLKAWPLAVRGELDAAALALGDFSVLDIAVWTGLEGLAAAAVVFSAVGTPAQRVWTYDRLRPYAGTHVVVGGCASYHAAVDHHLGTLAAALGDPASAEKHLRSALAMHERIGAAGWARVTEQELALLAGSVAPDHEFRPVNGLWQLAYDGVQVQLADSKGLRDLAVLIGAQGNEVHVSAMVGSGTAGSSRDPVLDETARAQYKARLASLAEELDQADAYGDASRAEKLSAERDALVHELRAATGLGGRTRRLDDETERARKTVSARIHDTLTKLDQSHPALAAHLRASIQLGTSCTYSPTHPVTWRLK
ncbi:AAA family ATPase [Kribbella sp. NPDC000426]|uniref:ATP-binding protein n=1 Tax=Kribbella sp. NPDC000426 TaxID=3154255 RepID=UPI0033267FAC